MIEETVEKTEGGRFVEPSAESITSSARQLAEIMGYGSYDQLPLLPVPGQHGFLERIVSFPHRLSQMVKMARGEGQVVDFPTPGGLSRVELWTISASLALDGGYNLSTEGALSWEVCNKLTAQAKLKRREVLKRIVWSDQTGTGLVFLTPREDPNQKVTRIAMVSRE